MIEVWPLLAKLVLTLETCSSPGRHETHIHALNVSEWTNFCKNTFWITQYGTVQSLKYLHIQRRLNNNSKMGDLWRKVISTPKEHWQLPAHRTASISSKQNTKCKIHSSQIFARVTVCSFRSADSWPLLPVLPLNETPPSACL